MGYDAGISHPTTPQAPGFELETHSAAMRSPRRNPRSPRRTGAAALLVALAVTAGAGAQAPVTFNRLGVRLGLAGGTVTSIAQDRQGFLWFGTRDGLSRYDGAGFESFRHDTADPTSLSADNVTSLWAGRGGELWIGTFEGGVDAYDPVRGEFSHYPLPAGPDAELPPRITALLEDRHGRIWAGTARGLWYLDPNTRSWAAFRHQPEDPSSLGHDQVMALLEDPDGGLWVGTFGGGLDHLLPDGGFEHFGLRDGDPTSLSSNLVQCLYRDSHGTLWVGTAGGGLDRQLPNGSFEAVARSTGGPDSEGRDHVHALTEDGAGNLWIATYGGGLERLDRNGELTTFRHNPRNPQDPSNLPHNFLLALYRDSSGGLWMGTDGSGVASFHASRDRFNDHFNDLVRPDSLSHNTVWAFYEDPGGTMWIGTSGGLNRFDRDAYRFTLVPDTGGGPRVDVIWSLYADPSGDLWLGTFSSGLRRFDPHLGRFEDAAPLVGPDGRGTPRVRAITGDGAGGLWLATQGSGLLRYTPTTGEVVAYRQRRADGDVALGSVLTALQRADDGRLWVGTQSDGLARFDPATHRFEYFRHDPDDDASLSSDTVHGLLLDEQQTLWVGTAESLDRWQPAERSFRHYPQPDREGPAGLSARGDDVTDPATPGAVYCIVSDGQRLWMSTATGLSRMDRTTGVFRTFDAKNDLHGNRFDTAACYRSPSGEIFFGGIYGFHSFDPHDIRDNPHVPPMALTAVYVLDRKLTPSQLPPAVRRLRLSYLQNLLRFEFAALDFANPERNLYSYRLEGFDRDWIDAGHRRQAVYANLPPGDYTFRVRGSNNDGVWNEEGLALPLTIRPPILRSAWAYGAYAAALVGLVGLLLRTHGQRIRQRGEDQRKTEELERARTLQLSMLPTKPPHRPDLDIAVHMETATEVGGDYYDFFPQPDGSLFVAVGDATGHGLSAGMMVSMTKIALRSLDIRAPARILDRLSEILREIHPSGLRMALGLAFIRDEEVEIASAAMPPVLVYDHRSCRVEEVLLPALPLGGRLPRPYPARTVQLTPGDAMVLISDGLPERRNPQDECLGYRQVQECLEEHGGRSAREVLDALVALGDRWAQGRPPEDDVTVVVVRRRPAVG